MNVQTHVSGQVSGQVPNQGTMPQQNMNNFQTAQMQTLGGSVGMVGPGPAGASLGSPRNPTSSVDQDLQGIRHYMQTRIFAILQQRQPDPADQASRARYMDVARRLEEGLLKMAVTKEDYMNIQTLEARLTSLIRGRKMSNHNPQHANSSSASSSVGTMIPTPGMAHGGNSNMMVSSSVDTSINVPSGNNGIAPAALNSGSMLHASGMHGGNLSNGYQQSSANLAPMAGQRITSQMIPTPGLNNSSSNNLGNSNSQSYMNMETSSSNVGFSAAESRFVPQQQQQRLHIGSQNSRILRNLGSQMGCSLRSGLQQKSYGLVNGSINSGLGMNGNNVQRFSNPKASEGYMNAAPYANSSRAVQSSLHGEGYGANHSNSFGSGNYYGAVKSVGLTTNSQNMNSAGLQTVPRSNSALGSNQSTSYGMQQAAQMKHEPIDQFENVNFQPSLPMRESLLLPQQRQQPDQQPHHFQQQQQQQQQQLFHQQQQLKQINQQQQQFINGCAYGQPVAASDMAAPDNQEPGAEPQSEMLHSQASDQFHRTRLQSQSQMNAVNGHFTGVQPAAVPNSQHDIYMSVSQDAQQSQPLLNAEHVVLEPPSDYSSLSDGVQAKLGQWHHSQSIDGSQMLGNMPNGQHMQEGFRQRLSTDDEARKNNLPSDSSGTGQVVASGSTVESVNPPGTIGSACKTGNGNRDPRFRNQQRWLLFLRHARSCTAPKGKCQDPHCITVQNLLEHMSSCNAVRCQYPRCHHTKILINHHKYCKDSQCPVCVPVKNYLLQQQARLRARLKHDSTLQNSVNGPVKTTESGHASNGTVTEAPSVSDVSESLQPSLKRLKVEPSLPSVASENDAPAVTIPAVSEASSLGYAQSSERCEPVKPEVMEVKSEVPDVSRLRSPAVAERKRDVSENMLKQRSDGESMMLEKSASSSQLEDIKVEKKDEQPEEEKATEIEEDLVESKSGKPKIKGVSLIELFTPEQVTEHIRGLRRWVGQSKAKAEKHQAMGQSMNENSCQLCAVEKLTFEPPPIYCSPCGARIKRNAMYYTMGAGEQRHYICIPCYNESRGDSIMVDGVAILKAKLEKKKNDEETEEWWVQCDKCEAWQHQICALFNGRRNDGGQAEYTCPKCYIEEVKQGKRKPLPQSAVLGAKDLPRTILSDHIEQRLFRRLRDDRLKRARAQGKSFDEVPEAEALVVRVVSSVDKKLEVKPRFLEIFREENYPTEFPYKSKVVLLFQKIEGVEVCLFGMYVQEFGSECSLPNQRRVYLSYLDSVKYFRPEVKAASGEALRTFVYHEILIGYLEYCKLRGFTSCYIWACPPLKGEDYILYCHPEIQKTPKSDKLREWYLSMLRKAAEENIVVECVNLYDHFFVQSGECRAKVTAARLPYFDGDYWPGAAEDLIYQMTQEEDGRKNNKKGTTKKTITKRALKASGHSDLSGNASKDLLLMHKLGETISPMKEDFIMVHLQRCCTHCCTLMVSGKRYYCDQCKNFNLCEKCYESEEKREERERHPVNQKEKHTLKMVEITGVPEETKDKDEILESEFFDTRQQFLSLCQGNHYQYDTLRRAKHSSMMVLYHLHNPTAPAFVTTCSVCCLDIETGQGWRCEICPEIDVCNACYSREGGINHPHKLTNHPSLADRDAQNKEARQQRVTQLRKMLDLLVHASQCPYGHCQYPNCRKVKGLFRHGMHCRVRASGGCVLCKKMWYLLQLHARACKESECNVPRCRDLKEHLRRLQQQSDSRRRAAVMEMMRQRAAEVAGNSG